MYASFLAFVSGEFDSSSLAASSFFFPQSMRLFSLTPTSNAPKETAPSFEWQTSVIARLQQGHPLRRCNVRAFAPAVVGDDIHSSLARARVS